MRFVPRNCIGLYGFVLAYMDKYPCPPARPLVSDVAVKGFGGRKTFHRVAAILIHLPSDKCSPPNIEGAGQLHVYKRYTRLLSKNIHFNCFEYQLFCPRAILRKIARIAISRKRHFRSPKRKNENTLQYKVPPKTWENSPQKPILAIRKWFFGH